MNSTKFMRSIDLKFGHVAFAWLLGPALQQEQERQQDAPPRKASEIHHKTQVRPDHTRKKRVCVWMFRIPFTLGAKTLQMNKWKRMKYTTTL